MDLAQRTFAEGRKAIAGFPAALREGAHRLFEAHTKSQPEENLEAYPEQQAEEKLEVSPQVNPEAIPEERFEEQFTAQFEGFEERVEEQLDAYAAIDWSSAPAEELPTGDDTVADSSSRPGEVDEIRAGPWEVQEAPAWWKPAQGLAAGCALLLGGAAIGLGMWLTHASPVPVTVVEQGPSTRPTISGAVPGHPVYVVVPLLPLPQSAEPTQAKEANSAAGRRPSAVVPGASAASQRDVAWSERQVVWQPEPSEEPDARKRTASAADLVPPRATAPAAARVSDGPAKRAAEREPVRGDRARAFGNSLRPSRFPESDRSAAHAAPVPILD